MKTVLVLVAVAGVTLSGSIGLAAPPKGEANALALRGTEAAKNGQWDDAIDDLRKATQMDHKYSPSLVAALLGRAANEATQQQFQQAANDYDDVIKLDGHNVKALEGRASMAIKSNDMDKAAAMYAELSKINPKEIKYVQHRAYIYEVKGDLKNAMAENDKILKLQKDDADALARKARLETRLAQEAANNPQQSPPPGKP
jgi:tetratricopeptide (TPR) repeat protein